MEKNFFMTWIGNDVPDWALYAFGAFKSLNPDFKCEFVQIDPDNCDEWDERLIDYHVKGCTPYLDCKQRLNTIVGRVRLSELVRYYLVQTYGGIIADCDVYPIKPFDDNLIESDHPFKITKVKPPNLTFISDDIFFMGGPKNCNLRNNPKLLYPIKLYDYDDTEFIALREKFFRCELESHEHYNDQKLCYIDHFDANSYNRHKQKSNEDFN